MPAKGKRVAARQAQLNRRRRRQDRSAPEVVASTARQEGGSPAATMVSPTAAASATAAPSADAAQRQSQPSPAPARPVAAAAPQGRNTQPLAYAHLARELRRILILAGIVTAVLLSVSFAI